MTTTSLKLPDELKQRAAQAAQEMGVSPHAFMIAAIEQAATSAEIRSRFITDARQARNELIESGKGFDADDVHAYLKAKVEGKANGDKVLKPKQKSWRR